MLSKLCRMSRDGLHEPTIIGNPYSAMTYTECSICGEREERGEGLFYGKVRPIAHTMEQRVSALEASITGLESQLAEVRAEVERLSALTGEWCKTAEMYRRFETETSKQTAGEICDYLQRSSTDDEISKGYVIDHIKRRFGLEG